MLDIGTGTATLAIMMRNAFPQARIVGLDGDEKILTIAKNKIQHQNLGITLIKGMSFDLPFPDNHFDIVTSSLMVHHLKDEDKVRTFKEVLRVLKPGGEFCIADWGKPKNIAYRLLFLGVQFLDGFETTSSNAKGFLPKFLSTSGFVSVEEVESFQTMGGTIALLKAKRK